MRVVPFSAVEKSALLRVKGVGPKVVERLEQMGVFDPSTIGRRRVAGHTRSRSKTKWLILLEKQPPGESRCGGRDKCSPDRNRHLHPKNMNCFLVSCDGQQFFQRPQLMRSGAVPSGPVEFGRRHLSPNISLGADTQQKKAAARHMLRAGQLPC